MQHSRTHIAGEAFEVGTGGVRAYIEGVLVQVWRALRLWHRTRITIRALDGLSDRTLHDIGFDRSEIPSVAREHAEKCSSDRIRRGSGPTCRA